MRAGDHARTHWWRRLGASSQGQGRRGYSRPEPAPDLPRLAAHRFMVSERTRPTRSPAGCPPRLVAWARRERVRGAGPAGHSLRRAPSPPGRLRDRMEHAPAGECPARPHRPAPKGRMRTWPASRVCPHRNPTSPGRGGVPHKKPTGNPALPGILRHSLLKWKRSPYQPLCRLRGWPDPPARNRFFAKDPLLSGRSRVRVALGALLQVPLPAPLPARVWLFCSDPYGQTMRSYLSWLGAWWTRWPPWPASAAAWPRSFPCVAATFSVTNSAHGS